MKSLLISRTKQETSKSQWSLSTSTHTNRALDSLLRAREIHQEWSKFTIQVLIKDKQDLMSSAQESKYRKRHGLPTVVFKNVMETSWRISLSTKSILQTFSSVHIQLWKKILFFWKIKASPQFWTFRLLKILQIEAILGLVWHSYTFQRELKLPFISQLMSKTKRNKRWKCLLPHNISTIW